MNGYEQQEIAELKKENEQLGKHLNHWMQENSRLEIENWQLKGALGYPVPGDIPTGDWVCGLCAAREEGDEQI